MDVGAYLSRIGYQGPTEPTWETLRALHHCHLFSVPFESLSVHCGEPIILALPLLYDKIVRRRRGGFCYENNGLFLWLLQALGFSTTGLAGRVRNRFTGRFGPPCDHLVLLVRLGDQHFLCDVGFGDGFLEPLRLEPGLEQPQESGTFQLGLAGDVWALKRLRGPGEEQTLYTFTLEERELGDFAAMCRYHQCAPSSIFACKSFCSLPQPGGRRLTYMGWRFITTQGGQRTETVLQDHEIPALLLRVFGAQLSGTFVPKDQDIQPPPEREEIGLDPPTPPKQGNLILQPSPTE
uniref:arylamine N-acetyltransferase n=1 Tax=Pelusios castaneus TaxID=367368 RepID=A0A8C8VLV2_9SAUR